MQKDDVIYRRAAIDELEAKKDKSAKGDIGCFYNTIIQNNIDALKGLPSAQPEIEPANIDYYYCSNAMLKMWMDNILTDGEYNKIMDKLNKFEMERRTNDSD